MFSYVHHSYSKSYMLLYVPMPSISVCDPISVLFRISLSSQLILSVFASSHFHLSASFRLTFHFHLEI